MAHNKGKSTWRKSSTIWRAILSTLAAIAAIATIIALLYVVGILHPINAPPAYTPPPGARLFLSDPLKDNSQGHVWPTPSTADGQCGFQHGGYDVTVPAHGGIACEYGENGASPTPPRDVAIEVRMTLIRGFDTPGNQAGIVFRADGMSAGYFFGFDAKGDGTIALLRQDGSSTSLSDFTLAEPTFHRGYGSAHANNLAVEITGATLRVFVNAHFVTSVTDTTFQSGFLGVDVGAGSSSPAEAVFSDLTVWALTP